MKKKYKYILIGWCCTMSLIFGLMFGYVHIFHPDQKYVLATIVYIIYAIIMALGVRKISAKSRQSQNKG